MAITEGVEMPRKSKERTNPPSAPRKMHVLPVVEGFTEILWDCCEDMIFDPDTEITEAAVAAALSERPVVLAFEGESLWGSTGGIAVLHPLGLDERPRPWPGGSAARYLGDFAHHYECPHDSGEWVLALEYPDGTVRMERNGNGYEDDGPPQFFANRVEFIWWLTVRAREDQGAKKGDASPAATEDATS